MKTKNKNKNKNILDMYNKSMKPKTAKLWEKG